MTSFQIRTRTKEDEDWVGRSLELRWGSRRVVSKGRLFYPEKLDGLVAMRGGRPVGLLTFRFENGECEVVTLDSFLEGQGVGSALLNAARDRVISEGCSRLWLITTNDNLRALRFYQKWGLKIAAVHRDAMEESRKIKPEIPAVGKNGIPLRDEIEMEILLVAEQKNSPRTA